MALEDELRDQLVTLVNARCIDPLEVLLQDTETLAPIRSLAHARAEAWARDMVHARDDTAGDLIMRLVATLYPSDEPFDPPASWWRTPMGQVTAWRVGHPTAERVSYPVAGAMLGISRQGVHDLIRRGKLVRHPDGGVTPGSIRDRLRRTRKQVSGIAAQQPGNPRSEPAGTAIGEGRTDHRPGNRRGSPADARRAADPR